MVRRQLVTLIAVLAWGSLSGCSAGDDAPGAGGGGGGPLYILMSGVSGTEDLNYVTPVASLQADGVVDASRSIVFPGVGRLYGQEGIGYFAVGSGESQTITRYDIGPGDTLVPGARLSLAGHGVTLLTDPGGIHFVSATKAYYLDQTQLQIIVWNPRDMVVTGTISLAGLAREGAVPSLSLRALRRGNQLVLASGHYDPGYDGVQPGISLIIVDTVTDTATVQPADQRCRDPGELAEASDGSIYVFSNYTNVFGAVVTGRGGAGRARRDPPCTR